MFCIIDKFKKMHKELSNLLPQEAEMISVNSLPFCMACIDCNNLSYSEILSNTNIHINIRYIYLLINGMHSVAETYATNMMELLINSPDDKMLLMERAKDVINKAFETYHLFYDLLLQNYPLDFGEEIDHELIHAEIQKYGFSKLLVSKDLKIKHIIHHTHLMMMKSKFLEAMEWLINFSFALMHTERQSFARSKHIFMNEQVLLIGSALTEGEAEHFAERDTKELFKRLDINIYDFKSKSYVIERYMYKLLHDKCNISEAEMIHSLFTANSSFLSNLCLFPKILKCTDELDLITYKMLLSEI